MIRLREIVFIAVAAFMGWGQWMRWSDFPQVLEVSDVNQVLEVSDLKQRLVLDESDERELREFINYVFSVMLAGVFAVWGWYLVCLRRGERRLGCKSASEIT